MAKHFLGRIFLVIMANFAVYVVYRSQTDAQIDEND